MQKKLRITTKKVIVSGVSRIPFFMDKLRGRLDSRQGVLKDEKGARVSPWTDRKSMLLQRFVEKEVEKAAKAVSGVKKEAETLAAEYASMGSPPSGNAEIEARTRSKQGAREVEIRKRLAEVRADLEDVCQLLQVRVDQAKSLTRAHIHAYDEGLVAGKVLPPEFQLDIGTATDAFKESMATVMQLINHVLNDREV